MDIVNLSFTVCCALCVMYVCAAWMHHTFQQEEGTAQAFNRSSI